MVAVAVLLMVTLGGRDKHFLSKSFSLEIIKLIASNEQSPPVVCLQSRVTNNV